MPRCSRSRFVTKRSSPTSWTRSPSSRGQRAPAVPVVLGGAVLDRDDRVARRRGPRQKSTISADVELAALEAVDAVAVDLGRRRVERDRDAVAVPGALGRLEDRLDRRLARRRGRARSRPRRRPPSRARARAAPSSARGRPRRRSAAPRRTSSAPAGTTMNSCRSIEFSACAPPLITFIIGTGSVRALVAAEVAVERDAGLGRGGLRGGERDAEDRVRAEPALVRRAVELDQRAGRAPPGRRRRGRARRRRSRRSRSRPPASTPLPPYAAPPSRSSTASCTPVEAPDGTAARPSAPDSSRDVDLDGRVAARVEDLAGVDVGDRGSSTCLLRAVEVAILLRRAAARSSPRPLAAASSSRRLDPRRRNRCVVAPQRELGIDVRAAARRSRPRTARRRARPRRAGRARVSGAGLGAASSARSSRSSSSRSASAPGDVRVLEADRRRAPLHLARVEQRRQRLGHVVEDALAALLLALELLPVLAARAPAVVGLDVAEDVRVARARASSWTPRATASRSPSPRSVEQQREEVDLEEQVAELVEQLRVVAGERGVRDLVGLLDRVRDDRRAPSARGPTGTRGAAARSAPAARAAPRRGPPSGRYVGGRRRGASSASWSRGV